MTLAPSDLGPEFRDMVTTQQYDPAPRIDGIRLIDLRLMSDDGGSFAELVRLDEEGNLEGIPGFKVRQSSYSFMLPGSIKAFHLHYNQEDVWFVPPTDRILVGLIDARKDSPSYNVRMRIAMGGGKTQLLYIPRGVAHGAANLTAQPAVIFYYVNQHFSLADPDERRLPWDAAGKDFWEMTRG